MSIFAPEPRCATCSLAHYEHQDHAHTALAAQNGGRCPFGDCGQYTPRVRKI